MRHVGLAEPYVSAACHESGGTFIGTWVTSALWGLLTAQVCLYYSCTGVIFEQALQVHTYLIEYATDPLWTKGLVVIVW